MNKWNMYSYRNWNGQFNSYCIPAVVYFFQNYNPPLPLGAVRAKRGLKTWFF